MLKIKKSIEIEIVKRKKDEIKKKNYNIKTHTRMQRKINYSPHLPKIPHTKNSESRKTNSFPNG